MMSVKGWISQLLPKSLGTTASEGSRDKDLRNEGQEHIHSLVAENGNPSPSVGKMEALQIKFLRLLIRFGLPRDNLLVSRVLYRIQLAILVRGSVSGLEKANLETSDKAQRVAAVREVFGLPELDFSIRILVLGRTGAGKSSTINSVLDQMKAATDAFQPATRGIQEVVGTVNGVRISFIDTPGLLPSSPQKNRKVLHSVKRFLKKSPPDMVFYFERADCINKSYSDLPLLKLVSEVFGPAIWFNTIIVMTHADSDPPDDGLPDVYDDDGAVVYGDYIKRCTGILRQHIDRAVTGAITNPVLLVENHDHCVRNIRGEKLLQNGQVWKDEFFLLCFCTKILGDVNRLLEFKDAFQFQLGQSNSKRLPSLPHLLSSFLKHHIQLNHQEADDTMDDYLRSDSEEEDEYDQLPPNRILRKAQFDKLSCSLKKQYLDELDYREILYLKKQTREEYRRKREKLSDASEPVLLPDMAVPPSFDSDHPVYRYRCLVTNDQWLARPVLDPHGWDHDVGFDGINVETALKIRKNVFTCVTGQMSKDKQDFSIRSECGAASRGPTDSVGKELICTFHGNVKLRNFKYNLTDCGICLTSFGNKTFFGAKVEDSILMGKRVKLSVNAGQMMGGGGEVAYGGGFEATLRGRDYPVRNDKVSLTTTVLSSDKDTVFGANLQSDFRILRRGTKMSVTGNLNTRKMGQICIKTSSSECMEIALVAAISILSFLCNVGGMQ